MPLIDNWRISMSKLTDDQLSQIFKDNNGKGTAAGLRAVYDAGAKSMMQGSPPVPADPPAPVSAPPEVKVKSAGKRKSR
jgi:hypothetical protein